MPHVHPLARQLALLVLAGVVASPLAGATYYVATTGSDAHPGTLAQPWATLQHAADTVGPGDTVVVRGGAYAGFHLETSGTPAARIVWRNFPNEEVEITADNPVTPDGINLEGASYVTLEGFEVRNRTRAGIRAVLCRHVHLRFNFAEQNGRWGIFTGCCEDLVIEYNVTGESALEHGIYVSNSGDRPILRNNFSYDNRANGIHMNGDRFIDCGGVVPQDGTISNALVEGNVLAGNGLGGGSAINCDGVTNSTIRNNLIFAQLASGISLYRIDGQAPSSGNRVIGNTVHVAAVSGRWALNVRDDSSGTFVRNNTFWSDHSFRGAMSVCSPGCLTGFDSDYNAVEDRFTLDDGGSVLTLAQWRTATGQDQHSFVAAPADLFVAPVLIPANADYRLKRGSPAVNAGVPLADLFEDLAGSPRPLDGGVDIGALEALFATSFERGLPFGWSGIAP